MVTYVNRRALNWRPHANFLKPTRPLGNTSVLPIAGTLVKVASTYLHLIIMLEQRPMGATT